MIETRNECQLSANLLLLSHVATVVGCTEVLFQPRFLCVAQQCYLWNTRHTTRWFWYGMEEQSTLRVTEPDTARIETERALVRLLDTSSVDSRLYQAKRQMHTIHAWIVPSFVVSARTIQVVPGPTLRAW